jgi:peptidase M1-like protein
MSRKLASLVFALVLVGAGIPAALAAPPSQFPAGAAGIGDPYFPSDGNGGYDVQHYDLAVTYDPATDRLTGVATIQANATQNLSAFNFDFLGLRLREVTVNGASARTQRKGQELTVKPANGITNGSSFTVVARYDGVPKTLDEFGLSGFIHTDDGALVIGEPHVAATWFPANDHPRDKASFSFHITVPTGLQALSNGELVGQQANGGWTTWNWNNAEPMTTYLAMMAIGHFDIDTYVADGLEYWDAIDSALLEDLIPPVPVASGAQFLYSQMSDFSYKRLTRTISVPAGGAQLSFDAYRNTEESWDFLFVEARTAGGDDWTTLPDLNGHTTQETGACPYNWWEGVNGFVTNPFLEHYLTPFLADPGDPDDPDDDFWSCTPSGTTGDWNARSGSSDGWETWTVDLADAGGAPRQVEVSITYASDWAVQLPGVAIDDIAVSTGVGSTGFENDGDVFDGWVVGPAPVGDDPNENSWVVATEMAAIPGVGTGAQLSFDRQPEIISFESDTFGAYPWSAAGGIVDNVEVGFALENQTRPTYSPFFFGPNQPNDYVVVHELAHQWFGDSLAVDTWQHIWLNEGFATYAEWLWSEHVGDGTAEQIFNDFAGIPPDDEFWNLAIGDPGPVQFFDFPVYARGAMTLHALREEVGDHRFFEILQTWAAEQANGNVTTREFIDLAERIYKKDLDPLFDNWLSAGYPVIDTGPGGGPNNLSAKNLKPAAKSLVERLHDRGGQPFKDAKGKNR